MHQTHRTTVPNLEAYLNPDKKIPVLDHGFIRLVDYMGDDNSIIEAARVSYGDGTIIKNEARGLIRYLLRRWHTSPFEQCEIKFHIKCPIFVMRQLIRHRTANVNEISGRYSILKNEFYSPDIANICKQSEQNKQGRENSPIPKEEALEIVNLLEKNAEDSFKLYDDLNEKNIAREITRINLPLSTYTEFYWKIDLHNLMHFLRLRLDSHAQYEIVELSRAIAQIVQLWVPLTWEAFIDYRVNAVSFSGPQMELLRKMIKGETFTLKESGLGKTEYQEMMKTLNLD